MDNVGRLRQNLKELQQIHKALSAALSNDSTGAIPVRAVESYVQHFINILHLLKDEYPNQLRVIDGFIPERLGYNGEIYTDSDINRILSDCSIVLDSLSTEFSPSKSSFGDSIFITHGRDEQWHRLQPYLEKQLKLKTIELSQQAYRGRHTLNKLDEESNSCCYAIVVMTGDDISSEGDGNRRARPNVLHEIGFFQAKYGIDRVCLMYEEGTEIPSNIDGLGRVQFEKGKIETGFSDLHRELQEFFDV